MKLLFMSTLGALLLSGCAAEKTNDGRADNTATATASAQTSQTAAIETGAPEPAPTASAVNTASSENQESGTWSGQIKVADTVSMFNYVGAESGDFAPMRFRNDSEAGKQILAACSNDDLCEFTGVVEWLDEAPPPDASAIGQITRVDRVKRLPSGVR
jgi:hypothetical protein